MLGTEITQKIKSLKQKERKERKKCGVKYQKKLLNKLKVDVPGTVGIGNAEGCSALFYYKLCVLMTSKPYTGIILK